MLNHCLLHQNDLSSLWRKRDSDENSVWWRTECRKPEQLRRRHGQRVLSCPCISYHKITGRLEDSHTFQCVHNHISVLLLYFLPRPPPVCVHARTCVCRRHRSTCRSGPFFLLGGFWGSGYRACWQESSPRHLPSLLPRLKKYICLFLLKII